MQGTIMSLDSAIQMISEKKRAVIGEQIRMIGQNELDDNCGELTSLEEMDMSNMQDQSLLQLEREWINGQMDLSAKIIE